MGSWMMHIEGHGIHDNGSDGDADSMLRDFAGKLRAAGHKVHAVTFGAGAAKTLPAAEDGSIPVIPGDYEHRS